MAVAVSGVGREDNVMLMRGGAGRGGVAHHVPSRFTQVSPGMHPVSCLSPVQQV